MGNIESSPPGSLGPVDCLKHRLQSLEETIRSIEIAHQDAQGDHFPAPGAADVCIYGARLACTPGVQVLTGPVIGEVTLNSAVVLLEVKVAPELGTTARVCCYVSLVDDACPRGRVVCSATLDLPSRRPRAFHIGGGVSNTIGPARAYTVCFGGVCVEDARFRVGRFRTPGCCFKPSLQVITVSGDRADRLAPGEPSLWRVLRERVTAPTTSSWSVTCHPGSIGAELRQCQHPVDVVVHAGGQAWMADAFEDAWELLKRRAMDPVLCADGGWVEAQEEAAERMREAMRRAWNLPDKRAVLSSVANLMVCGAADLHPEFEGRLSRVSSTSRGVFNAGRKAWRRGNGKSRGKAEKERHETRALHAAIRVCRRVYCEYQGQLLWKAVAPGRGRGQRDVGDYHAAFGAEERGVEDILAETRRIERNVAVKEKKVAMAEEALRRAKAAGKLPAEGGLRAVEERIDKIRKEAKMARAAQVALANRDAPVAAAAAAKRASQGGFLNLGGAIGLALLDTAWTRVSWDGKINDLSNEGDAGVAGEHITSAPSPPLLSPGAWENLELELSRDSELRLLLVVMRNAIMPGGDHEADRDTPTAKPASPAGSDTGDLQREQLKSRRKPDSVSTALDTVNDDDQITVNSWGDEKDRLLDLLFAWKAGEAWREVVVLCGAADGCGGRAGLRSSCELEILDAKHPGCTIRQIVAGPITDDPAAAAVTSGANLKDDHRVPRTTSKGTSERGGRFSHRWNHALDIGRSTAIDDSQPNTAIVSDANVEAVASTVSLGGGTPTAAQSMVATEPFHQSKRVGGEMAGEASPAAPGWDDAGAKMIGPGNNAQQASSYPESPPHSSSNTAQEPPQPAVAGTTAGNTLSTRRRQLRPVSADGERSFLEAFLDGGHSPATAIAAGLDPAASARGVAASVEAEAVTIAFVGAAVVLGPVVGRVTQRSAVVLLEVGSTAAVGCVLTDGLTGGRHRQVRLLYPGQPHAFFFETLEENRPYSVSLDGVDNADARTGAFTTLKAWPDRREPPALRAATRLSERGNTDGDDDGGSSPSCDVRLLFVSGTGLAAARGSGGGGGGVKKGNDDGGGSPFMPGDGTAGRAEGVDATAGAPAADVANTTDMWGVLGRDLWRPWPQADVMVHTGSQVDLEVAVIEALPFLSVAEDEEEGSEEREEAEHMAMERIREAYRFQWSLPGPRACLSCGSHLMLRGEADLALPRADRARGNGGGNPWRPEAGKGEGGRRLTPPRSKGDGLLGLQVSAYARLTLSRLASQAFSDYQRQLWDPLSVPVGLDINDVGYARGGVAIDSVGPGDEFPACAEEARGWDGEWHFHVFGETVGLFAMDIHQGSAGLKRDERAPLLSDAQWSSLARALSIEEVQAMIVVGDAPFVSDSILDARAKARHPSQAHLRRSWPFHGGELLRLVRMLVQWKAAGATGGEPREVTLVGGGLRCPLETVLEDSATYIAIHQIVCGPFCGIPSLGGVNFELGGELAQGLSYHHTVSDARSKSKGGVLRTQNQHQPAPGASSSIGVAGSGYKVMPHLPPFSAANSSRKEKPDGRKSTGTGTIDVSMSSPSLQHRDDPGLYPSCVLVRCEARGAGPSARLSVRSRLFTAASWASWCNDGDLYDAAEAQAAAQQSPLTSKLESETTSDGRKQAPPPSPSSSAVTTTDMGRPRSPPRWVAIVLDEESKPETRKRTGGGGAAAAVTTADVLTVLRSDPGAAEVLVEAFEQVLDVEEDEDEDEALAAARGGTGDATRRVFDSLAWAYDDDACAGVRTLCPTRPSPVVVRHLLKSRDPAERTSASAQSSSSSDAKNEPRGSTQADAGAKKTDKNGRDESCKSKKRANTRGGGGQGKKKPKPPTGRDEGLKERGDGEEGVLPTWLFAELPFHDDESFGVFFCEVLRDSERLAARFG